MNVIRPNGFGPRGTDPKKFNTIQFENWKMEKGFVIEIVISLVEIPPIKYSTFNLKNFWETKFTRIFCGLGRFIVATIFFVGLKQASLQNE